MKIVANIAAGIIILFGVLNMLAAFSTQTDNQIGTLITGTVLSGVGLAIIWYVNRKGPAALGEQKVTYNIDLSGDVKLEGFECTRCGGPLGQKDISVVAGAPTVQCPYCSSVYQISEQPKW